MRSKEVAIARVAFGEIQAAFPELTMILDLEPEHVDVAMEIPAQPGLSFPLHLNLQNRDELHLSASALWVEWFPCTDPSKVSQYVEAVSGLISGRFRILEHRRGTRTIRAELQRPGGTQWETLATWSTFSLPWPAKTVHVVRNVAAA